MTSSSSGRASPIILAVDIGSSSIRCSAYEWDGRDGNGSVSGVVLSARKLRATHPVSGKIYAEAIVDAVDGCVDETIQQLQEQHEGPYAIIAVGLSSFVMNLIGVGAEGEFLSEELTISYACNTDEISDEVRSIRNELGEDRAREIYIKTGAPIHNAYALAQLRFLYSKKPQACQRVEKWQTISSVCLATWMHQNHLPISYSEASWTGLMNYQDCSYEQSALDLLPEDCCNALPDLMDYDEPRILSQGLPQTSPYFERWPGLRDARFFLGVGDGVTANIGSKCTIPTRIACTVGTSAACRVILPLSIGSALPSFEPGLFCYRVDKGHVVLGGSLTDGGSVVEWVRQLLNVDSSPEDFEELLDDVEGLAEEDMVSESASSKSTAPRLTFVPFLNGERSTGFQTGATAAMIGMTRTTTPAHFAKACIEGATLRMGAIVKLIRKSIHSNSSPCRIIASGKALESNSLWRQALSDCTGLEVIFDLETHEGTSRGVACLLALSLGLSTENIQHGLALEVVNLSRVAKPRPATAAWWDRASRCQEDLITALAPLYENP